MSGKSASADQSAIEVRRGERAGSCARAAARPTATCPMLATLLVFDFEAARDAFDLMADGELAHLQDFSRRRDLRIHVGLRAREPSQRALRRRVSDAAIFHHLLH